jgi:hypothetical protein
MTLLIISNFSYTFSWALHNYIEELRNIDPKSIISTEWKSNWKSLDINMFTGEDTLLLVGNFRDFRSYSKEPSFDQDLEKLIRKFPGNKAWQIYADLDHRIEDIVFGKKTLPKSVRNNEEFHRALELMKEFNILIWSNENSVSQEDSPFWPKNETTFWSRSELDFHWANLLETERILRDNFFKRIEWQHCVDLKWKIPMGLKSSITCYDLAIIGRKYDSRLYALTQLELASTNLNPFQGTHDQRNQTNRIIRKLGESLNVSSKTTHLLQIKSNYFRQQTQYLSSSAAWMDPGYFGYFVRKYLEATVMGCALVGEFNSRIENLGFVSGVNCAYIPTERIESSTSKEMIRDRAQHRFLANNAMTLVETLHSTQIRARQIYSALIKKEFKSVYKFLSGEYVRH